MAKRRSPGEGSVYQRDGDTSYYAQIDLGVDGKGRRHYKTKKCKTKREAVEALARWSTERQDGKLIATARDPFRVFLGSWLDVAAASLDPNTVQGYRTFVRAWQAVSWNATPLGKVTPLLIARQYAEWQKAERSAQWLHHAHRLLHAALNDAVDWRLIATNPSDRQKLPKLSPRRPPLWSPEQVKRFFEAIARDPDEPFFTLTLLSGAREGELLGLRRSDVRATPPSIEIRGQMQELSDERGTRRFYKDHAKSEAGHRIVMLDQRGADALRRQEERVATLRARARSWEPNEWIFPTREGKLRDADALRRKFYTVCDRLGLPRLHLHDLRHFHASVLAAEGVSPTTIQKRLGHATVHQTLAVYTHVLAGEDAKAARAGETILALVEPPRPEPPALPAPKSAPSIRRRYERVCPVCGATFWATKRGVYCTPSCKWRAIHARKTARLTDG